MTRPSWDDFNQRRARASAPTKAAGERSDDEIVALHLSDELLRVLYGLTIDSRCRPGATEAELREAEAKRHLVHRLETMREAGRMIMAEKARNG